MIDSPEARIRERAHKIWEREGRPQGREAEHWATAAAEIAAEDRPAKARVSKPPREEKKAPAVAAEPGPAKKAAAPKRAAAAKTGTKSNSPKALH